MNRPVLPVAPAAPCGWRCAVAWLRQLAACFMADNCLQRSAALTFTSTLSLVPFLALLFSVLKGLGVQNTIEPLLLEQVAAGSEETVRKIILYINNTQVKSLGVAGLLGLLVTVVALLDNIEEAFNAIWGVTARRSFTRKVSDYLTIGACVPLLMLLATGVTTTLQSRTVVRLLKDAGYLGDVLQQVSHLLPYLSIWAALAFLYLVLPNTRVSLYAALVGGVSAGTAWQLAQWGYIHFQVGMARYNGIYGTMASLPIFMVWLYASWAIVLCGLEIVYAVQHRETFLQDVHNLHPSPACQEQVALAVMFQVGRAFAADQPPWSAERLGRELQVPLRLVQEVLAGLQAAGYLLPGSGDEPAWLPAHPLEHIPVTGILEAMRQRGAACHLAAGFTGAPQLGEVLSRARAGEEAGLEGLHLGTLVALPSPAAPGDEGG